MPGPVLIYEAWGVQAEGTCPVSALLELLKQDNKPQMELLMLSPMSPSQDPIIVLALPQMESSTSQSVIS